MPPALTGRRAPRLVGYGVAALAGAALAAAWAGGRTSVAVAAVTTGTAAVLVAASAVESRPRRRRPAPARPAVRPGPATGPARLAVHRLIARDRLRMACQPIVDLTDGTVVGAEALARFLDQPGVSPEHRFASAHLAGAGIELELHAVRVGLRWLAHLPRSAYLALNVSPHVLAHPGLVDLLDRPDVPVHRLVMEVTEHESVVDYRPLRTSLGALRQRGLRVAVDDAGSGFASFNHVLSLEADVVKLDRTLIRDIDRHAGRRALAAAMVLYGLETGARVVAEGVETPGELALLRTLGIDAAQGYFLGRPAADPAVWRETAARAAACCRPTVSAAG